MVKPIKIYRSRPASLVDGNFGDELTELFLTRLFGRAVEHVPLAQAELIGVGSILDSYWRQRDSATLRQHVKHLVKGVGRRSPETLHVWGSGAMLADSRIEWPQRPVYHAVRGKMTAVRLGDAAPNALGDPGILAPLLLEERCPVAEAAVSLVPHFVDEGHVQSLDLPADWRVIHTDRDAIPTISAIAASELVISSSLHGLITADAFGIPCVWATSHNDLYKKSVFKFHDHASVRGTPFNTPRSYTELALLSPAELHGLATSAGRDLGAWRETIRSAFPAELSR